MCKNIIEKVFKSKNHKFIIDVVCKTTINSPTAKHMQVQCSEAESSILHRTQNSFAHLKLRREKISLKFLREEKPHLKIALNDVINIFVHSSETIAVCYVARNGVIKCLVLRDILNNVEIIKGVIRNNMKNLK